MILIVIYLDRKIFVEYVTIVKIAKCKCDAIFALKFIRLLKIFSFSLSFCKGCETCICMKTIKNFDQTKACLP